MMGIIFLLFPGPFILLTKADFPLFSQTNRGGTVTGVGHMVDCSSFRMAGKTVAAQCLGIACCGQSQHPTKDKYSTIGFYLLLLIRCVYVAHPTIPFCPLKCTGAVKCQELGVASMADCGW